MIERDEDGITLTLGRLRIHASSCRGYYAPNRDFFLWISNKHRRKLWIGGTYIEVERK
ncbi:hypothetical protein [Stenotrophomonas phage BUCT603B1]|nr:hypothetical protein [Stenotrophomonas phage BUCT603B1]